VRQHAQLYSADVLLYICALILFLALSGDLDKLNAVPAILEVTDTATTCTSFFTFSHSFTTLGRTFSSGIFSSLPSGTRSNPRGFLPIFLFKRFILSWGFEVTGFIYLEQRVAASLCARLACR